MLAAGINLDITVRVKEGDRMTELADRVPARDLAAYLRRYPEEITFGSEDSADVFDRYHTPDYVLISDGLPLDRERLLAHVRAGRRRAAEVKVSVQETMISGGRVAARYVLTAVMRKGQVISTEIFMFGCLAADGRLQEVVQLTRGLPEDRTDQQARAETLQHRGNLSEEDLAARDRRSVG